MMTFKEFAPKVSGDHAIMAYNTIAGLDLGHVTRRVAKEAKLDQEVIDVASDEYKKFLYLVALGNRSMAMCSAEVDEIWHTHILFTQDYAGFCRGIYGAYLHHMPATDDHPVSADSVNRFKVAYNSVFGQLHPIWTGQGLRCILDPPICSDSPGPPCGDCGCKCKDDDDDDDDDVFWS